MCGVYNNYYKYLQNPKLIIAYKILKYLQIVSELLCATASTDTVSEGMDTTDSQSIVPSTSDAATQVVTVKMRSVHVSEAGTKVNLLHTCKHIMCMDC